jgi:hypothetical protein
VSDLARAPIAQNARQIQNPAASRLLRRQCACGNHTVAGGECPECARKKSGLQRKLAIGASNDPLEREADRVTDQLMAAPAHSVDSGAPPRILRYAGQATEGADAAPTSVDHALSGPGRPLAPTLQQDMERRFGQDFSRVRVHTDENAATSARTINAHAYTVGNDIVFGPRRFEPSAMEGRRLLAHELTHVIQQSAGHAPRAVARKQAEASAKTSKCHTGCAGHWGQDTICSKWGFVSDVRDYGGKKWRGLEGWVKGDYCCDSWPFALEQYAVRDLGLDGAASCTSKHEKEIATVTLAGKDPIKVLCSDTICGDATKCNTSFGETNDPKACWNGAFSQEVIELSPNAMSKLSGNQRATVPVSVCYSGSQEDLCLSNSRRPKSFPEIGNCVTDGCAPPEGTPKLENTGWPRS